MKPDEKTQKLKLGRGVPFTLPPVTPAPVRIALSGVTAALKPPSAPGVQYATPADLHTNAPAPSAQVQQPQAQQPQAQQSAPAAPGSASAPAGGAQTAAPVNAAPEASQTPPSKAGKSAPQKPCKTCNAPIWVRKGKVQDYCSAVCKAQAELDQSAPAEGACQGCRKPLPESKRGKRYCSNSCRARASERRASETLASTSIIGWQKAFETSRRENDALVLANSLLQEKLAALTTRSGS